MSLQMEMKTVDIEAYRNVSADLSFDGYQVLLNDNNDKSLHLVTNPKYLNWQLTRILTIILQCLQFS